MFNYFNRFYIFIFDSGILFYILHLEILEKAKVHSFILYKTEVCSITYAYLFIRY